MLTAVLAVPAGAADTTTFSGTVGEAPTITNINPVSGNVNTTVPVTINGTGFVEGQTTVDAGEGITVTVLSVTASEITANFAIDAGAAAGERDVTVTAAGQTSTVNDNSKFTVNAYITVNAPDNVDLGVLPVGGTKTDFVPLSGEDPLVSTNATAWTVSVQDTATEKTGFLKNGVTLLADDQGNPSSDYKFQISKQSTTEGLTDADTGIEYDESDEDPVLYYSLKVPANPAAGTYSIILTFTGSAN